MAIERFKRITMVACRLACSYLSHCSGSFWRKTHRKKTPEDSGDRKRDAKSLGWFHSVLSRRRTIQRDPVGRGPVAQLGDAVASTIHGEHVAQYLAPDRCLQPKTVELLGFEQGLVPKPCKSMFGATKILVQEITASRIRFRTKAGS